MGAKGGVSEKMPTQVVRNDSFVCNRGPWLADAAKLQCH